jgi:hypothetical protein
MHKRTIARRLAKGWTLEAATTTPSQGASHNLLNKRFGRLTVIAPAGYKHVGHQGRKFLQWLCRCDCGNEHTTTTNSLNTKGVKSCGCLASEVAKQKNLTHGHAKDGKCSSTFRVWQAMLDRCRRPKSTVYHYYGGRGISVCPQWASSFQAFLTDMGERPTDCQLDRINNNGNYEPANCRWATKQEQIANRRNTQFIQLNGQRVPYAEASRHTGVAYWTIRRRAMKGLDAHGCPV